MKLIVDANILFAALVKDGKTAELLFRDDLELYAPEFLFEEFTRHRAEILAKTKRSSLEFERLLDVLKRRIKAIPESRIAPYLEEARRLSPDKDDSTYFAAALAVGASIWSNDKILGSQSKIRVWTTAALLKP